MNAPALDPQLGDPEYGDAVKQRDLRRMKVMALGLLLVAAVVFVVARTEGGEGWVGYLLAFAEAAMVGALADWFAVTALFRHPLGIPIPHTAIIPKRKDQIGRSLGDFVETNFLTHEVLSERLAQAHIGRRLGHWLADPQHAGRTSEALADALKGALEVLDDREVQEGLERMVRRRVEQTPAAPLLGRVIDVSIEGGHHQRLLDGVLVAVRGFLEDNRATFRKRLEKESPWWVPEPVDDRIFEKIYNAVGRFLDEVAAQPDHELRHSIDERVRSFARRLEQDPELLAKGEALKAELLEHPDVRAWLESLWEELKQALVNAADDPGSELRVRMTVSFRRMGERLLAEPELQAKVDRWIERALGYVVDHYRSEVSELIAGTVERWDGESTARKMELQVGRDLQFIRINGTLVGGLAGLAIHAIGEFL